MDALDFQKRIPRDKILDGKSRAGNWGAGRRGYPGRLTPARDDVVATFHDLGRRPLVIQDDTAALPVAVHIALDIMSKGRVHAYHGDRIISRKQAAHDERGSSDHGVLIDCRRDVVLDGIRTETRGKETHCTINAVFFTAKMFEVGGWVVSVYTIGVVLVIILIL